MKQCSLRRLLAAGALVATCVVGAAAQASSFSGLVVFGDSLSDDGNNSIALSQGGLYPPNVIVGNTYIPTYPYAPPPTGTYSNGPVWASYFATMLGLAPLAPSLASGTDFAFGGARTGPSGSSFPYSLRDQADQYLAGSGGAASASALYVVAGGGNNARDALLLGPAGVAAAAAAYAADVGAIVDELQAAGAQHILVWNAPNLGLAPAVQALGAQVTGFATFLSMAMNDALTTRLAGEAGVSVFDLFGFGSLAASNPQALGFVNATDSCGAIAGANCSQYLYWDGIHPTTAAHLAIAGAIAATIPEPQTYLLLTLGLVAVVWQARRRGLPARARRA
jgi:outer membrane lipase/esterase